MNICEVWLVLKEVRHCCL